MAGSDWVRGNAVGSGSFGVVNLAMSKTTGELFVVKSASSGPGLQTLKNETNILKSLESPHIVRCLGHELIPNQCSTSGGAEFNLFMEYMAGGSLSEIINKFGGALAEPVVKSYTREILKGIHYLHSKNIIHCDLKCKNVLLGSSGNVKLADFGSAKRLGSSRNVQTPSLSGTPLWMAPEALRNEEIGLSADIWSLGCTVIEMAIGRPPWAYSCSDPMSMVYKIACSDAKPDYPLGFSKEGIDFLDRCLDRDPKKRWSSEELLEHPFLLQRQAMSGSGAPSPTSVIEFGFRGGKWYEDDEEEVSVRRIPFSVNCSDRMFDMQDTGGWIEVRSG